MSIELFSTTTFHDCTIMIPVSGGSATIGRPSPRICSPVSTSLLLFITITPKAVLATKPFITFTPRAPAMRMPTPTLPPGPESAKPFRSSVTSFALIVIAGKSLENVLRSPCST
jgi:hypothetical protein